MKHFLFLAVSLFIGSYSFSQKVDETLSKKYTSEELKTLKKVDSKKFELINFSLQNACYVIDAPSGKNTSDFKVISVPDLTKLNFQELGLSIIENQNQYFLIQGTTKMLVVKSAIVLNQELSSKK
jgi:hypothetical protein